MQVQVAVRGVGAMKIGQRAGLRKSQESRSQWNDATLVTYSSGTVDR